MSGTPNGEKGDQRPWSIFCGTCTSRFPDHLVKYLQLGPEGIEAPRVDVIDQSWPSWCARSGDLALAGHTA